MDGGPGTGRSARARRALRWLGAPPTVLALVVLVLNDHVWKHQWPGTVTGKVSDAAGLLVAPPLIALFLAPVRRARRPDRWAVGFVGLAFTLVKASAVGAAAASAAWSVLTPSLVRADATDLLTLPVLLLALRTAQWAREPGPGPRRRATLAVGALVLPCAVLDTAATSACQDHAEVSSVTAVSGRFATSPPGWTEDFVISADASDLTLQAGRLVHPGLVDQRRINEVQDAYVYPYNELVTQACSRADPSRCWRLPTKGRVLVESSTDGGTTWDRDYAPGKRYREGVVDDLGEKCGKKAVFDTTDVAVVDTPDGPVVAVALRAAGLAVRATSGSWSRVPVSYEYQVPTGTPAVTTSPLPSHPALPTPVPPPLVPLDPVTRRPPEPTGGRPARPTHTCQPQCRQVERTQEPRPT